MAEDTQAPSSPTIFLEVSETPSTCEPGLVLMSELPPPKGRVYADKQIPSLLLPPPATPKHSVIHPVLPAPVPPLLLGHPGKENTCLCLIVHDRASGCWWKKRKPCEECVGFHQNSTALWPPFRNPDPSQDWGLTFSKCPMPTSPPPMPPPIPPSSFPLRSRLRANVHPRELVPPVRPRPPHPHPGRQLQEHLPGPAGSRTPAPSPLACGQRISKY